MRVFRLARKKYAKDLTGTGAKLNGGRWNSKGNEALYSAEHISLAKLEVAVHLSLDLIPDDYCLITLELPKSCKVKMLSLSDLPIAWDAIPYTKISQQVGDAFLMENKFLALKVPSAIIPQEFNYILNPFHTDYKRISILAVEDFNFDTRLLG